MRLVKVLGPASIILLVGGCLMSGSRLVTTQSPGVERIPTVLAFFPLLTAQGSHHRDHWETGLRRADQEVYIVPPAETELVVSFDSQMLTNTLAAELSYRGFAIKELPVAAPEEGAFSVGLGQLDRLRDQYGLQGLLIGNVSFKKYPAQPYEKRVRSLYLKLVDIETLDILCHFNLPASQSGEDPQAVVTGLADELALLAGLRVMRPPQAPQPESPPAAAEPEPEPKDWKIY